MQWIESAGGKVINLLTKGSLKHCQIQLGKSLREHLYDIESTIQIAIDTGLKVNVYLEDWSSGFLHSPDYIHEMMDALIEMPIKRFLLPDTLAYSHPKKFIMA